MSRARDLANFANGIDASKITSGTFADARIAASNVSQHATSFDDNKIVNDISTLGLRVHTQENLNASNTNSASFDVFQDGSGIASNTNAPRNDNEYVSSVTAVAESGGTLQNPSNFTSWNDHGSYGFNRDNGGNNNITTQFGGPTYNFGANSGSDLDGKFWFRFKIPSKTSSTTHTTAEGGLQQLGVINSADILNSNGDSLRTNGNNDSLTGLYWFTFGGSNGTVISAMYQDQTQATISKTLGENHSLQMVYDGTDLKLYHSPTENNWYDSGADLIHTYTSFSGAIAGGMKFVMGVGLQNWSNGEVFAHEFEWKKDITTIASSAVSATGSFESNPITAASTSKMGAVLTYQDNAGTNALNTDIILKLSADNGSNYSTATLTALPDFATGIKMAKVNDLSVTAGTQLKYKIEFANQALGSKEARIRGVSLQY